ncbi:MAG: hypothetical protein GY823_00535 [Flavobacteriaceae bacterium]|nr:hypothetical protein [Flavobacteriaceae bacterium]
MSYLNITLISYYPSYFITFPIVKCGKPTGDNSSSNSSTENGNSPQSSIQEKSLQDLINERARLMSNLGNNNSNQQNLNTQIGALNNQINNKTIERSNNDFEDSNHKDDNNSNTIKGIANLAETDLCFFSTLII